MDQFVTQGGVTAYQFAALHLLDQGDPASAVVAAELGVAREKKTFPNSVGSKIVGIADKAWKALEGRR
ncbi:MAG TPA: hypothetical protein VGF28_17595 [Thermoanaerobaculia bacterium]|jgi:hypothetical protein